MTRDVARLFDAMAGTYDVLEPWYEHLYATLHRILQAAVGPAVGGQPGAPPTAAAAGPPAPRALDAGCGTGFQSALLRELGYLTEGLDLSAGLLAVARRRCPGMGLVRADVQALPYRPGVFAVVVCCGSTLSFVTRPDEALAEMGRVLRPGGRLLLECERRWSLDLAWQVFSALAGDCLGYGMSTREAGRALARPFRAGVRLDYPGYPGLRLFTRTELVAWLRAAGLSVERSWGIHAATNLMPSTLLHWPRLPPGLGHLYRWLRALDAALATSPARRLASSLVLLARKVGPPAVTPCA